jgi:hypothetical protein
MSEFKLGDLVEFIPENFEYSLLWKVRLIGVGYIEDITQEIFDGESLNVYHVYCGKIIKQQMKNFVEIEVHDQTYHLTENEMVKLCRKLNLK